MTHSTTILAKIHSHSHRLVATLTTFTLGLVILAGVGFVQGNNGAIHNATHDTRHGMNFPCH